MMHHLAENMHMLSTLHAISQRQINHMAELIAK